MENPNWALDDITASGLLEFDSYVPHKDLNQLLTPPESYDSFGDDDPSDYNSVSVSTSFFPGAQVSGPAPDLILVSSDNVHFYVNSPVLLCASENGFNFMLPATTPEGRDYFGRGPILAIPELASVLSIILHTIYDIPCPQCSPSFDTLVEVVSIMKTYGISPKHAITPSTSVHGFLLGHAATRPLELFALASHNDLYELAVSASSFLLSMTLSTLSDEMAEQIGPVYLKRLFFMHLGRAEVLRKILLPPPYPHTSTPTCSYQQQKYLTSAWTLASAYLAWDARADLSTSAIESALSPLADRLSCELCRAGFNERIKELTLRWSTIKRSI